MIAGVRIAKPFRQSLKRCMPFHACSECTFKAPFRTISDSMLDAMLDLMFDSILDSIFETNFDSIFGPLFELMFGLNNEEETQILLLKLQLII